jgi:hypothetical protein
MKVRRSELSLQNAARFSSQRPMDGGSFWRYSITPKRKIKWRVDMPLETSLSQTAVFGFK